MIKRFNFQTWDSVVISIQSQGPIQHAEISENFTSLAFYDLDGLKYFDVESNSAPELLSSYEYMSNGRYEFNDDGSLLAFADGEALKIFDTTSGEIRLLLEHNDVVPGTCCFGRNDVQIYMPIRWSPRNNWIIALEGHHEGRDFKYIQVESGLLFPSSLCLSHFASLPGNPFLVMSVASYRGAYDICGDESGIYMLEFGNIVTETQLFEDLNEGPESTLLSRIEEHGYVLFSRIESVSWSPNGDWIAFVESITDYKFLDSTEYVVDYDYKTHYKLGVITLEGVVIYSLESDENIAYLYPDWSVDSKYIYFTEVIENQTLVLRLSINTQSISPIGSYSNKACMFEPTPNNEWYLIGFRSPDEWECRLSLLDISSGDIYPLAILDRWLLGWEN